MKTISAEEFKKLHGEIAYKQFAEKKKKSNVFQRIGANVAEAVKDPLNVIPQRIRQATTTGKPLISFDESGQPSLNREEAQKISDVTLGFTGGGPVASSIKDTVKPIVGTLDNALPAVDSLPNPITNVKEFIAEKAGNITESKIDPQVKTMLQESPVEKFDRYVKSGEEALTDPRKLTPLEKAGDTAYRTAEIIKEDLGNIGKQKSATLESVGDLKIPEIATTQIDKIKKLLQMKLTKEERSLVNEYLKELESLGKTPSARSVDASVDKLQSTLYEKGGIGAIPMTTRIKTFVNQSIKELNGNLKSAVDSKLGSDDYSKLNSAYSRKKVLFNALNKRLGEGGDRGGSLMKRFFSPQDAGTKKLFDFIKKEYGIDLAQDATIAKFVMDTLGDTRAASLLKLPPTSKTGLIDRGLEFIERKLTSPKKVLGKAREKTLRQKSLE